MRTTRRSGFTFIELMVVIVLIGLMSALVVANLEGMTDESTMNASAREFGNTLLSTRDEAAVQGRELVIEVEVEKGRWRRIDAPSPTDVPDPEEREEQTYVSTWWTVREGVVFDEISFSRSDVSRRGTQRIVFDRDGQVAPAGFVAYFRHEGMEADEGVSVELTGLTGLVDYRRGRHRSEEIRDAGDF